jgi:hypothetical protein
MEIREGFKNLSKIKLYFKGSISVISKRKETIDPGALPLPGPTIM